MSASTCLSQGGRDIDSPEFLAPHLLTLMGHCIRDHEHSELTLLDDFASRTREDRVCDYGDDFDGAVLLDGLRGLHQSAAGVCHVVH